MNLQDIDVSAVIAIVILVFVIIGFIKGLVRILLTLIALSISAYTAWLGFCYIQELGHDQSSISAIGAFIIWLTSFIVCLRALRFIIAPFNSSKAGKKIGYGRPAAILSFIAVLLTVWTGFIGVRYAGSIADLRHTKNILKGGATNSRDTSIRKLKTSLDSSIMGNLIYKVDPVNSDAKLTMAKIMLIYHDKPMRTKMLPAPIFDSILNDQRFLEVTYLDDIKDSALSGDFVALYHNEIIAKFVTDEQVKQELKTVKFPHEN